MPEPTSSAALTLASSAIALPALTIAGVSLGVRVDVLLAGFAGAVAAMSLLDTVPSMGDTWHALLRTSARRVGVSIGSAATAAYITPLLGLINGVPDALMVSTAFVAGAGAQKLLLMLIARFGKEAAAPQDEPRPAAGGGQ